jgi:beta-phosphoglucomutase family hydrolase
MRADIIACADEGYCFMTSTDIRARIRLPEDIRACLFDMDGVLTNTAKVHSEAWKEMFDAYLKARDGDGFIPFDVGTDYVDYVDGKLRQDGVRSFLHSRSIELPEGTPADPPDAETIYGLGNRKNELVLSLIREKGVEVFEGSVRFVKLVREAGMRTAVVSASKNTEQVLKVTGLTDLFDERVDGVVAAERGLPGKPAPDTFITAADLLDMRPGECAIFEDATSGVQAGYVGRFGWVVGVDRVGRAAELLAHGADVVVEDLSELMEER